jgi:hypothetical protein
MTTRRSNIGSLVGGAILILVGVMTLMGQWISGAFWGNYWPFIVIGVGALFFVGMLAGGPDTAALAIPGSIISAVGLILWLQQTFGHYESWSYAWTVIIMAVGFGLFVMGWRQGDARRRVEGQRVMQTGLVLFILFGAFFEMVFRSFNGAQYLFPAALILLGVYLVAKRSGPFGGPQPVTTEPDQKTP